MQGYAVAALGGPRWQALITTMRFVGVDLSGAAFRLQGRLVPNTPGPPLFDLSTVGTAAAEGVRLISVETIDGKPVSTVGIRVNQTTMEGLPFTGEIGDSSVLAWDMQVTPAGGLKQKWIGGDFIVEAGVTGADSAPYQASAYGFGGTRLTAPAGMSTFQIAQTTISVTMAGGQGPRGLASGPLGAESVGAEEINGSDVPAMQDKLGITGQVVGLSADTTIPEFTPRAGDAFNLNGHTLTIERMPDTALTDLFRGAGQVVLKSGFARPEWWQTTSYRAAAMAVMLGGGGTVQFGVARYPSESTDANPLPLLSVRFTGAGMPEFAGDFSTLMDGTILEGPVVFASKGAGGAVLGHNVVVERLGVDSGQVVCGQGPDREGMIFPNIGQDAAITERRGIIIRDVRVLCRNAAAPVHCVLVEKSVNALIEHLETVYGANGWVSKSQKMTIRKTWGRGHSVNPGILKSDAYGPCVDNVVEDVRADPIAPGDTGPFRIQANGQSTSGHVLRNVRCRETALAVSIETPGVGRFATDITLDSVTSEATLYNSVAVGGSARRVSINNLRANNVLQLNAAADYIGNAIDIGVDADTVTITGAQIYGTAGDGIRNRGQNVVVTGSTALAPGAGRFGFNGAAGAMKVPASSNLGTTNGAVSV